MKRIPVIAISMLLASQGAAAQVPQIGDLLPQGDATTSGRIIQYVLLLTVLSVAPSILIMVTSFTRFIVAFSFLRAALGMQSTPANLIITSLCSFSHLLCHGSDIRQGLERRPSAAGGEPDERGRSL